MTPEEAKQRGCLSSQRYNFLKANHNREAHKEWYGTILPMDHPWWKDHTPPVDWGCECSIKNTDKPVTDVPEGGETIDPVFAFNPADTAEIVNMKEHPYVKNTDAQSAEMIMKLVNELLNENTK